MAGLVRQLDLDPVRKHGHVQLDGGSHQSLDQLPLTISVREGNQRDIGTDEGVGVDRPCGSVGRRLPFVLGHVAVLAALGPAARDERVPLQTGPFDHQRGLGERHSHVVAPGAHLASNVQFRVLGRVRIRLDRVRDGASNRPVGLVRHARIERLEDRG